MARRPSCGYCALRDPNLLAIALLLSVKMNCHVPESRPQGPHAVGLLARSQNGCSMPGRMDPHVCCLEELSSPDRDARPGQPLGIDSLFRL